MKVMISLVGEQPIPNLLAIRAENPDVVVLVYSALTAPVADRLQKIADFPETLVCPVMSAYDLSTVRRELERRIRLGRWRNEDLVFNLTGGTKAMAMAAYEIVKSRNARFLYLQSEGRKSTLYSYVWQQGTADSADFTPKLEYDEQLPGLISVDEYIRVHVGDWKRDDRDRGAPEGRRFEALVRETLIRRQIMDDWAAEVRWTETLEADLIMRKGANYAIAEIKQGKSSGKKDDLQQIAMITQQRVFGTYVQPIFIVGKTLNSDIGQLARDFGIAVIELPSWETNLKQSISAEDEDLLCNIVAQLLVEEGEAA